MKTFKENSYDIVRLYVNQIGIMIFSMFLYTAVGMVDDNVSLFTTLRIIVSVFSILFYIVLIYNVVWEIGAKDKLRIDSGRYQPTPLKGMIMSLYANIPNFVLAIFATLFIAIYLITNAGWSKEAFGVAFLILRFHSAMYMGVIQGATPASVPSGADMALLTDCLVESILFLVLPLVSVAFSHLAYALGSKEKRILGFLDRKSSK